MKKVFTTGYALKCYECNSMGADCTYPGDEDFGELVECPDSPKVACLTTHYYETTRQCAELPTFINDKDCIMRFDSYLNLYFFQCYCTTDGCNNFDEPPCGSEAGSCAKA